MLKYDNAGQLDVVVVVVVVVVVAEENVAIAADGPTGPSLSIGHQQRSR